MELEHSFRECFLEGDRTSLYYVARGLVSLQNIFGVIPTIQVKGSCAQVCSYARLGHSFSGRWKHLNARLDACLCVCMFLSVSLFCVCTLQ